MVQAGHSDDLKIQSHIEFLNFCELNNFPITESISFGDKEHAKISVDNILNS
jgi:hypothetical protein